MPDVIKLTTGAFNDALSDEEAYEKTPPFSIIREVGLSSCLDIPITW